MYIPNEPIPDCVPELIRQRQEEQDRQFDLMMQRRTGYLANQRKIDEALAAGLPILYYGGYYACGKCPQADHDTRTDDKDDLDCVICRYPACPEHANHRT